MGSKIDEYVLQTDHARGIPKPRQALSVPRISANWTRRFSIILKGSRPNPGRFSWEEVAGEHFDAVDRDISELFKRVAALEKAGPPLTEEMKVITEVAGHDPGPPETLQ
jgi:hypothetical protein